MPETRKPYSASKDEDPDETEEEELSLPVNIRSADLTCVHCGRDFTSQYGLAYHMNHSVCRPQQRTENEEIAAADKDPILPSQARKPKQKRGKKATVEEKTCPHCATVFTSLYGLNYHVKKYVCRPEERPESPEDTASIGMPDDDSIEDEEAVKQPAAKRNTSKSRLKGTNRKRLRELDSSIPLPATTESEDDADDEASPKSASRQAKVAPTEDDTESEYDDHQDEDFQARGASKGSRKRQKKEEVSNCPHCNKSFKSTRALEYHEQNFVCRPMERPDGPVQKGRRKLDENSERKIKYKKFRGAEKDRTCPDCGVIFSSVLGYQYHESEC
jgi:hypothetical protein